MNLGWQELLIILVIVVIVFGGAKIAGVGRGAGRAIREFKDELKGDDPTPAPPANPQAPAISPTLSSETTPLPQTTDDLR